MSKVFRSANGTQAAIFTDIALVAREEQRRLLSVADEPADVRILRLRAQADGDAIIAEAHEQAKAIHERAAADGYAAGHALGRAEAVERFSDQIRREREQARAELAAFAAQLDDERRRLWRETEAEIMAFVLQVAQKVVKDEATINRDVALSVTRNALRRVVDGESIRIRVNIEDLETVRASREDLMAIVDGLRSVEIVDDRRVGPGGCVIETASGTIDAKVETQIGELGAALRLQIEDAA